MTFWQFVTAVSEDAGHDEVDPAVEIPRDVGYRFALAELEVGRSQIDRVSAELNHPDLERDASAQARLLEDHRQRLACESRVRPAGLQLSL